MYLKNLNQIHNGTGDNVAGNKTIANNGNLGQKSSIPTWAQWIAWFVGVFTAVWAVLTYFFII